MVARRKDKLADGVRALKEKGIAATAIAGDASDPASIKSVIAKARAELGPITVLHWNAYGGMGLGDLLSAEPAAVRSVFDVGVVGLLSAVQAALPDLKSTKDGAILVTNGAFGEINPQVDAFALALKATGIALGNAAKQKLVGLLSQALQGDGIYVGEVTVAGMVKGTSSDPGDGGGIDPAAIANKFWELYRARGEIRARVA